MGLFGSMFGSKSPTVSSTASEDLTEEEDAQKKARVALTATEGGLSGEEVAAGQVSQRQRLFGN